MWWCRPLSTTIWPAWQQVSMVLKECTVKIVNSLPEWETEASWLIENAWTFWTKKIRACWNNGITTNIALHAFEACLWMVEATAKLQLGGLMGSICMSLQVNGMGIFWFSPFQAPKKMNPGYIWSVHICALTLRSLFKIVLLFFHVWQLVSKHQVLVRMFRSALMLHSKNDVQKATRKYCRPEM